MEIPLAAIDRLVRDLGIDRVSDDAKDALREILEDEIKFITRKAHQFSSHAGKNTILREHVKVASKDI